MPSFCAATARWCDVTASSSCSCREIAVLAAQVLRGLQHAAGHRVVLPARGGAAAGQTRRAP